MCAVFRQKWNMIFLSMFSLVYNHLKLRAVVLRYLKQALHIYIVSRSCHFVSLCFYNSSEKTNPTLALERAVHVLMLPEGHHGLWHTWRGWAEGCWVGCNLRSSLIVSDDQGVRPGWYSLCMIVDHQWWQVSDLYLWHTCLRMYSDM